MSSTGPLTPSSAAQPQAEQVLFSVVIPCFNEEESLPELLKRLPPYLEAATRGAWEIILVDDGSSDRTSQFIQYAHHKDVRVRGVMLSRNFGHQAAIFAGLSYASGQFCGIMDADLQDPPEVLIQCFEKARTDGCDLVYAVRQRREGNVFLKVCYWAFYRIMRGLAEYSWPLDAGDFSVFNRKVLGVMMQLPEHVRVLRGLRSWVGMKQGHVAYHRPNRDRGESKYSPLKLFGLATNALISFSNVPLRLATFVGVGMSVASVLLGVLLLINRFFPSFTLFGYYIGKNPGTTTIVILLLLIGSLLFLCLGIVGEYLGVVIKEVKRRPIAVVCEHIGLSQRVRSSGLILEASDRV